MEKINETLIKYKKPLTLIPFVLFYFFSYFIIFYKDTRFRYYSVLTLRMDIRGITVFVIIMAITALGFYTYMLYLTARGEKNGFIKFINNVNIMLLTVFCAAFLGAAAVFMYIADRSMMGNGWLFMVNIYPFVFYCGVMLFYTSAFYRINAKYDMKNFYWFRLFRDFGPKNPITIILTVILLFDGLFFAFEILFFSSKTWRMPLFSLSVFVLLTALIKFLLEFSDKKEEEYRVVTEEKLKSERFKTELITNVSHDIKTPLTTIINYVDLLGKTGLNAEMKSYTDVLERKSRRLKTLIEDLMEASKAGTGNIKAAPENIDWTELIYQIAGEYDEQMANRGLELVCKFPEEKVIIFADGKHVWRVMENIFNNAVKYSMEGTRIYAGLEINGEKAVFSLKNVSKEPIGVSADDLTEQFVRGDHARHTEGTGLGLYIAKSLTEIMGGEIYLKAEADLFSVTIIFYRNI